MENEKQSIKTRNELTTVAGTKENQANIRSKNNDMSMESIPHDNKQTEQNDDDHHHVSYSNPRKSVGVAMNTISDFVNDNLIAVRYGTISTIVLLTAYGISKTPIFFRFKNVAEIPTTFFTSRKIIHGRLVHVMKEEKNELLVGTYT